MDSSTSADCVVRARLSYLVVVGRPRRTHVARCGVSLARGGVSAPRGGMLRLVTRKLRTHSLHERDEPREAGGPERQQVSARHRRGPRRDAPSPPASDEEEPRPASGEFRFRALRPPPLFIRVSCRGARPRLPPRAALSEMSARRPANATLPRDFRIETAERE